jgi:hypothetical protein
LNQDMRTGKLYPTAACMEPFLREHFRGQVAELAAAGIYVGTSSRKYEDWPGLIYSPEKYLRYFKQGSPKLLKGRFQKTSLLEYTQTFTTVFLAGHKHGT